MADSLVCDHLCSTVHFSVLANGTDIGADTTGPVVFITDLYMVFCAGNFIHLVNAVLAFCETMGRAAFQAFSAVDAEIFLLHGICRDGRIGENGNDTKSWAEFLCDQVMAVTDGSHSRIISCHHMGKCRIVVIDQNINVIIYVVLEKDCLVSQTVHNIIGQTVCHIIQHPVAGVIKFLIDHRWRGAHHWRIQRNPQHDHIFTQGQIFCGQNSGSWIGISYHFVTEQDLTRLIPRSNAFSRILSFSSSPSIIISPFLLLEILYKR